MLKEFIPDKSFAVVAGYCHGTIIAVLGGVLFREKNEVEIRFPKSNPFVAGQKITFHLDNRTGLETFDITLRVYRVSVKAVVRQVSGNSIVAEPEEYDLKYGNRTADKFVKPGYEYPADNRKEIDIPESTISVTPDYDETEERNKLGVLITKAVDRPHTTVMAFLSTKADDIFIITHRDSFKAQLLSRDRDCAFAIDHRAQFTFEKAIDWNYSIIKGSLYKISRNNPAFNEIQARFVSKNPWEYSFFTDQKAEMYHIQENELLLPEKLTGKAD
ncbi:MAG TPA: hypothetical protein DCL73_03445 [Treponema sp.]|nr:hypothetical protein [Treponema sp.]